MAKITKIYSKTLMALLALLGISCDYALNGLDMYGSPSATFEAIGAVKAPDGKPIQGIRATLNEPRYSLPTDTAYTNMAYSDTAYTDSQGKFSLHILRADERDSFHIELRDVDGVQNGLYADFDLPLDYSIDDGDWFGGTATKDLGTITLVPASAPEYGVPNARVKNF